MHISIRRYRSVRSVAEVCRRVELDFVPRLRSMPGFIAYYAVDAGDGVMATVSIFSTEDMALESNIKAAAWAETEIGDLQPEPPDITAGKALIAAVA